MKLSDPLFQSFCIALPSLEVFLAAGAKQLQDLSWARLVSGFPKLKILDCSDTSITAVRSHSHKVTYYLIVQLTLNSIALEKPTLELILAVNCSYVGTWTW